MTTALALAALLIGCKEVPLDQVDEPCPEGSCLEHDFGSHPVGPYEEVDGICFSWTIGNDEPLWVNAVTASNDGWFHHSNWFWVPEEHFVQPDGAWPCSDAGFSELQAATLGGVIFAQSTQVAEETQQFLPGYVLRIPPGARIIANAHLLNWSDDPQDPHLRTRFDLVPESDVLAALAPLRFTYSDLDIPPGAKTEHGGSCDLRTPYEAVMDRDFDIRLHYLLPHFHAIGTGFTATRSGGPRDGEVVFGIEDAWGHPFGETFAEPVDLSDADGLRMSCAHQNVTDSSVGWGIDDQEMCVALGFIESGMMLDASVRETDEMGEDGDVLTRDGSCFVLGAPMAE